MTEIHGGRPAAGDPPPRIEDLAPHELDALLRRLRGRGGNGRERIPARPRAGAPLPLSLAQERLWFLDQLQPGGVAYNLPLAFRLAGPLRAPALAAALAEVLRRHEALRTVFRAGAGGPEAAALPAGEPPRLTPIDLGALPPEAREGALRAAAEEEAGAPFDLGRGPLLRAKLVALGPGEHALLLTVHHIVADAWSLGVLTRELAAAYRAAAWGETSPLPPLPIHYADFAAWQRERLLGEGLEGELAYWREQLAGAPTVLELPADRPRPPVQSFRGRIAHFRLPAALSAGVRALARREGATLFMVLLAVFEALLLRYTGREDLLVGAGFAGRERTETEPLVGFFVNTLALRARLDGNPTFRALLGRVREAVMGAYAHQDMPFERLVDALRPERDLGRNPLVQVAFVLQNAASHGLDLPGVAVAPLAVQGAAAKFDWLLTLSDDEPEITGFLEYATDLFAEATVERAIACYEALLAAFVADPERRLRMVPLFAAEVGASLGLGEDRIEALAPLNTTQRDLFLDHARDPESTVYSLGVSARLPSPVDAARWGRAVAAVVAREPVARTRFASYRGEPLQAVERGAAAPFAVVDLAAEAARSSPEAAWAGLLDERVKVPYRLAEGGLLRAFLVRGLPAGDVALLAFPHLLADAPSGRLLLERIAAAYEESGAATPGGPSFLDTVGASLARFDTAEVRRHWTERLSAVEPLEIRGAGGPEGRAAEGRAALSGAALAELRGFCARRAEPISLAGLLRGAFGLLLARLCDPAGDLLLHDVVNGRTRDEGAVVGCFHQVIPVVFARRALADEAPVAELLAAVRAYRRELGPRQHLSVLALRRLAPAERVRPVFNFYDFARCELLGGRAELAVHDSFPADEVHLIASDGDDELALAAHWDESRAGDLRLPERTLALALQMARGAARLGELAPLLAGEREQILAGWNDTAVDYRAPHDLAALLAIPARRTPEAIAAVCGGEALSYAELDARASRLAHLLRRKGVGAESVVAVAVERSLAMVVALVAVLQAGGAYLPLDPDYPAERLRFMLDDSGAALLVAGGRPIPALAGHRGATLRLEEAGGELAAASPAEPRRETAPEGLAYVIYTSGSTGRPKGAMNVHRAIANRLLWMQETYRLAAGDRVLHKTPLSFDVSVWEVFWPLLAGARLVVARPEGHRDSAYLARLIAEEGVTTAHFVPSLLRVFLEEPGLAGCRSLARLVASGEALPHELQERTFAHLPGVALENLYGPTEAAIDVTAWACEPGAASVPIGRPVANTAIYLLDRALRPLPPGAAGELYIGGVQLARGYLNRPDLTAERFLPDALGGAAGARLYRTGDLARHRPDGAVEYLGRADQQVKIRGQRIELGEIEAALAGPAIAEAVAAAVADPAGARLVAYLVPRPGETLDLAAIAAGAAARLPAFMCPESYVVLDALPLTPSGKLDRRALPRPARGAGRDGAGEPPRTAAERALAAIWRELLALPEVGRGDSFFALGGNSLQAMQLRSRVAATLAVDLPLQAFFEAQDLAAQAARVEAARGAAADPSGPPPLAPVPRGGPLALSFAQQRLWFLDQLEPGSPLYNIPEAADVIGRLDLAAMERSFDEIARRHEALRTTFREVAGRPSQEIAPRLAVRLPLVDLSALPEPARRRARDRASLDHLRRPFDLARGPLLQVALLRLGAEEHVLLLAVHHIVADGWSMGVLVRELSALYRARVTGTPAALSELPIQYADYAAWQRAALAGERYRSLLAYWRERLAGAAPLELPADRPRPAVETFRGRLRQVALAPALLAPLAALAQEAGGTLFMVLLAAYQALLALYSGAADVAVGTPIANRERPELEGLIGFFANTLVLRTALGGDPTFRELVARVRATALGAYAHQEMPFEKLVEELQPQRDMSRNPLFQVMLVLQNAPRPPVALPGLTLASRRFDPGTAKFDLLLFLWEEGGRLAGLLEHSRELFDGSTMGRLLSHFEALLAAAAADPGRPLSRLPVLGLAERHQLLHAWNDTRAPRPPYPSVHAWVEAQAARTPTALALLHGATALTYEELDGRANRLARHLRRLGVGPDALVGICVERSWRMVVGLLGVLKAGGAGVALDPTYPEERLRYVIADARLAVLLTQESLLPALPDTGIPRLCLDRDGERIAREEASPVAAGVLPEHTMYAIYTSGSTGQPKGISVPHRAFLNLLAWQLHGSSLLPRARTVQFATFGFCVSFQEVFTALCSGGTLVLLDEELRRDVERLWSFVESAGIERLHLPFAALKQLADFAGPGTPVPARLREVITAGEQLQIGRSIRALFDRLPACSLHNQYGASETHVVASFTLPGAPRGWPDIAPVGRPIANTRIHLVDRALAPVPIGVPGELLAGGDCLPRGYLGAPAATAAKLVPDPWSDEPGARLYRTGDLARTLPDGRIEYFGRIDGQVKIRGYRVELGEVETAVKRHPAVRDAAVVAQAVAGGHRLVAYVVFAAGPPAAEAAHAADPAFDALRDFLKRQLPEHMVPAACVPMAALPLNANGKLDREALPSPAPARGGTGAGYEAPRDAVEALLAHIWARELGVDRVGVHDNFFASGGHSLLATQVVSRVRRNFQVELPLRAFFESPTVAELAREVVAREARPGQSAKIALALQKVRERSRSERAPVEIGT